MIKIIKISDNSENVVIGTVEEPCYIKKTSSGALAPCSVEDAVGVAYGNTPYNLSGKGGVISGADTVRLVDEDENSDEAESYSSLAKTSASNAENSKTMAENAASAASEAAAAVYEASQSAASGSSAAEESKKDAEAWANGTKDNVPVGNTAPQFKKNAKYYAEKAREDAESAAEYASSAQADAQNAEDSKDAAAASAEQAAEDKRAVSEAAAEAIAAMSAAAEAAQSGSTTPVLRDMSVAVVNDALSIVKTYMNMITGVVSQGSVIIPLATAQSAGAMSPADVIAISTLISKVAALEGRAVRLMYTTKTNPSSSEIAAFVTAEGYTTGLESIAVVVKETFHVWHYYTATSSWRDDGTDTVSQFTNLVAGIIRGSATDGKVYAENDGTGSVYGWDALKGRVTSAETAINGMRQLPEVSALDEGKMLKVVSGVWTKVVMSLVTSISSNSTDTQVPSAKCVYDIIGDVSTLLAAI